MVRRDSSCVLPSREPRCADPPAKWGGDWELDALDYPIGHHHVRRTQTSRQV